MLLQLQMHKCICTHTYIMQLLVDIRLVVEFSLLIDCTKSVHSKLYSLMIAQMI